MADAADATLDVIEEEGLVGNAAARGAQFLAGLRVLAGRYPAIGDVRGLGLMLAIEFVKPGEGDGRVPNPELARRVLAFARAPRPGPAGPARGWGHVRRLRRA